MLDDLSEHYIQAILKETGVEATIETFRNCDEAGKQHGGMYSNL
jgi:hypothetical protein